MERLRTAALAGIIGVVGALFTSTPEVAVNRLFSGASPSWLPIYGTVGQSATLYIYVLTILGSVLMIGLAVGFGYYKGQQLQLNSEYWPFGQAIVAGTTIPLLGGWFVGVGAFVVGAIDGFAFLVATGLALRGFATISLPVIVGLFAGAALAHLSGGKRSEKTNDTSVEVGSPTE